MLILPNNFAIKNTKHCYEVGKRQKSKDTGEYHGPYSSQWYFTSLLQAVNFCIDRGVIIPKSVELMVDELENLKRQVIDMLESVNWTRPLPRDEV